MAPSSSARKKIPRTTVDSILRTVTARGDPDNIVVLPPKAIRAHNHVEHTTENRMSSISEPPKTPTNTHRLSRAVSSPAAPRAVIIDDESIAISSEPSETPSKAEGHLKREHPSPQYSEAEEQKKTRIKSEQSSPAPPSKHTQNGTRSSSTENLTRYRFPGTASEPPPSRNDFVRWQRVRAQSELRDSKDMEEKKRRAAVQILGRLEVIMEDDEEDVSGGCGVHTGTAQQSDANPATELGLFAKLPVELRIAIYELFRYDSWLALPRVSVQPKARLSYAPSSLTDGSSLFGSISNLAATSNKLREEIATYFMGSSLTKYYLRIRTVYYQAGKWPLNGIDISTITIPDNVTTLFLHIDAIFTIPGLTQFHPGQSTVWDGFKVMPLLCEALENAAGLKHLLLRFRCRHVNGLEFNFPQDLAAFRTKLLSACSPSIEDIYLSFTEYKGERGFLYTAPKAGNKLDKDQWTAYSGPSPGYVAPQAEMWERLMNFLYLHGASKELVHVWPMGSGKVAVFKH